jgi:hypothetical protein
MKTVIFSLVLLIGVIASPSTVYAADPGCTSSYPSCLIESPNNCNWDCIGPQGMSGCTIPAQPGDLIEFSGVACCKPRVVSESNVCGTAQRNSDGRLFCQTPSGAIGGNVSDDNWVWCGDALVGNACCTNVANNEAVNNDTEADLSSNDFDLCAQVGDSEAKGKCQSCFTSKGIWTAFGCVDYSAAGITKAVMRLGLGLGGTVVLLMVLAASFKLTTSRGDPKATDDAKEMFTNAFGGLLFVIFGTILTRIMGIDIFRIPGF